MVNKYQSNRKTWHATEEIAIKMRIEMLRFQIVAEGSDPGACSRLGGEADF